MSEREGNFGLNYSVIKGLCDQEEGRRKKRLQEI